MQTNQSGNHNNELMDTKKFKGKEYVHIDLWSAWYGATNRKDAGSIPDGVIEIFH
jgi:hypothetical protein